MLPSPPPLLACAQTHVTSPASHMFWVLSLNVKCRPNTINRWSTSLRNKVLLTEPRQRWDECALFRFYTVHNTHTHMEDSLHSPVEQDLSPTLDDFEASEQAVFAASCEQPSCFLYVCWRQLNAPRQKKGLWWNFCSKEGSDFATSYTKDHVSRSVSPSNERLFYKSHLNSPGGAASCTTPQSSH